MRIPLLPAPAVGDPLPDFVFHDASGQPRRLSGHGSGKPALILWLRHFG